MTANHPPASEHMVVRARALASRIRRRFRRDRRASIAAEVTTRFDRQNHRISATEIDLARIGPQVAALEIRVEQLRQRLDVPILDADDETRAQARSIIEEMRREHEQVRARITAAVRYEERLRQLEDRLNRLSSEGGADRES